METSKIIKNIFLCKIHSITQLITNSSTIIFTYSEGAVETVKELINEILKLEGSDKKVDDLFWIDVFLDNPNNYTYSEECPEGIDIDETIDKVLTGEIERPQWMKDIEEDEQDAYPLSTSLYIKAKDEKYSDLVNKLLRYLYSTNHEATGN